MGNLITAMMRNTSTLCSSFAVRVRCSRSALFSTQRSTPSNKVSFREPDPSKPKLVLAYSGGLDTSTQLAYLTQEKGFEVCAYIADLGQDDLQTQADKDAVRD